MLSVLHLAEYAGPNPFAAEPVVVVRIVKGPDGDGPLAISRMREAFPDWVGECAGEADCIAQWSLGALNEIRGFIHAAGARPGGEGPIAWLGYHHLATSRAALELAASLVSQAARPEGLDLEAADRQLEALWERCRQWHPDYQARVLMQGARVRGIPYQQWLPAGKHWQFGWGRRSRVFEETQSIDDSAIGTRLQRDKVRTKALMVSLGMPTPGFALVSERHDLPAAARKIGWPCVLKPNDLGAGRGVTAGIRDLAQLETAFDAARAMTQHPILIEKFARGSDHRLTVLEGRLVAAIRREPSSVVGDGERTVKELIDELNRPRSRNMPKSRYLRPIKFDEVLERQLAAQGASLQAVPEAGRTLKLRSNSNLSTGGICIDETARVHADVARAAESLARALNIQYCGVDYITEDISRPGGFFIEANATPGIDAMIAAGQDPVALATQLLGELPGRIPVLLVVVEPQFIEEVAMGLRECSWPDTTGWACGADAGVGSARLRVAVPVGALRALCMNRVVERAVVVWPSDELQRTGMPVDRVEESIVCTDLPQPWPRVLRQQSGSLRLLADAEARKDDAQQVVGAELAGDLVQRVLREAQLFGQQVERLGLQGQ